MLTLTINGQSREVDVPQRLGMLAALMKKDTQQMQAVEMLGLRCKNSIVSLFRLHQPAGLMQRERFGQQ